jgi:hypothetical protein
MLGALVRLPAWYVRAVTAAMRWLVGRTSEYVFHVTAGSTLTGSGDRAYDWVQAFCLLAVAIAGCALWSISDPTRTLYDRIYRWFRVS